MKKLFALLSILVCLVIHSQAQTVHMPLTAGDTVTNTGTASKIFTISGGYSGAVIQAIVTKLSGTGAGTVQLFGSEDGVNYKQIGADYTVTNVTTQSQIFYVTAPLPKFVKILETGSGTMSAVLTVYYDLRRYYTAP